MSLSRLASRRLTHTRTLYFATASTSHFSPSPLSHLPLLSLSSSPSHVIPIRSFLSSSSSSAPYPSVIKRPLHYGICIVPQTSAWVIERFGKFSRILTPGLHFLIPFVDSIAYIHSLKEQAIPISNQQAITMDNVTVRHHTHTTHTPPTPIHTTHHSHPTVISFTHSLLPGPLICLLLCGADQHRRCVVSARDSP